MSLRERQHEHAVYFVRNLRPEHRSRTQSCCLEEGVDALDKLLGVDDPPSAGVALLGVVEPPPTGHATMLWAGDWAAMSGHATGALSAS